MNPKNKTIETTILPPSMTSIQSTCSQHEQYHKESWQIPLHWWNNVGLFRIEWLLQGFKESPASTRWTKIIFGLHIAITKSEEYCREIGSQLQRVKWTRTNDTLQVLKKILMRNSCRKLALVIEHDYIEYLSYLFQIKTPINFLCTSFSV